MKRKKLSIPFLSAAILLSTSLTSCHIYDFTVPSLTVKNHFNANLTSDLISKKVKYELTYESRDDFNITLSFKNISNSNNYKIGLMSRFIQSVTFNESELNSDLIDQSYFYFYSAISVFYLPAESNFKINVKLYDREFKFIKLQPIYEHSEVYLDSDETTEQPPKNPDVDFIIYLKTFNN